MERKGESSVSIVSKFVVREMEYVREGYFERLKEREVIFGSFKLKARSVKIGGEMGELSTLNITVIHQFCCVTGFWVKCRPIQHGNVMVPPLKLVQGTFHWVSSNVLKL